MSFVTYIALFRSGTLAARFYWALLCWLRVDIHFSRRTTNGSKLVWVSKYTWCMLEIKSRPKKQASPLRVMNGPTSIITWNFIPFGWTAVTAFTRPWIAAGADGGIALRISITGCSWSSSEKKKLIIHLHLQPYNWTPQMGWKALLLHSCQLKFTQIQGTAT